MSLYDLRTLPDKTLADTARLLEAKVTSLRLASTALGIRLFQRYMDQLDAVRAEIERRSCD
jgi:hypothetical protein